jgi:DNA replication protein DnaC
MLPRMSNQEFDDVESQAVLKTISLHRCPTCGASPTEVAPGIYEWTELNTFFYDGNQVECDCDGQLQLLRHYLLAHIPKGYWTLGFDEYFGDPKAWKVATEYLEHWEGHKKLGLGLEFYSPTQGTGKTFLVSWIARQLIQRGERVYYTRFREIMGLYNKSAERREMEVDRLRYTPVVVLDEVGVAISEAQNHYFAAEFEELIRARTDDNRVTLMTTNLTPEELDGEYARTYSLLAAKQQRHEIKYEDARRTGDIHLINSAMVESGETRPLQ